MATPEMKTLVVATDLSVRSDRAMHRAFRKARNTGAKLIAVHVLDDALPEEMRADLHAKAEARMDRFCTELGAGVEFEVRTPAGDPSTDLVRCVEIEAADLLILGTHRPRPFLDLIRETTMQRIVRLTSCPVLLVRDSVDHGYQKIVAASDYSPASTAAAMIAHALAPTARIYPVHALHVPYAGRLGASPSTREALETPFLREAESLGRVWEANIDLPQDQLEDVDVEPGAPYPVLAAAVQRIGADLICVGAHGRVGAAPSILGSVASDLMRDPPCDVLIARPR